MRVLVPNLWSLVGILMKGMARKGLEFENVELDDEEHIYWPEDSETERGIIVTASTSEKLKAKI